MFVQSDNTESRSVENEIIRRLAIRVVDAFTGDVKSASTQARAASCDCHGQQVQNAHSDPGIVTLAAIEMVLEDAMYPVLERLLAIERKLSGSDPHVRQAQDVPITVTPSSTPAFIYDDMRPRLSPDANYAFTGSLFDSSDLVSSETCSLDSSHEYGFSADSISDSGHDDEANGKQGRDKNLFYRSFFKAPDPPGNIVSDGDDQGPHTGHRPNTESGISSKTGRSPKAKAKNKPKRD